MINSIKKYVSATDFQPEDKKQNMIFVKIPNCDILKLDCSVAPHWVYPPIAHDLCPDTAAINYSATV